MQLPARENVDLGHTAADLSKTCKIDQQICPTPQIKPTQSNDRIKSVLKCEL